MESGHAVALSVRGPRQDLSCQRREGPGAGRRLPRGPGGRVVHPPRPERLRQDHDPALRRGLRKTDDGSDPRSRGRTYRGPCPSTGGTSAWSSRATPSSLTSRSSRTWPTASRRAQGPGGDRRQGARDAGPRRAWRARRGASPASSPAASSSASPWPGLWSTTRSSCSSTSRSATSTPSCASTCARRSGASSSRPASRRSTSPTTRRRRCRSPTGSRSCTRGIVSQIGTPDEIYDEPGQRPGRGFHRPGQLPRLPGRARRRGACACASPRATELDGVRGCPGVAGFPAAGRRFSLCGREHLRIRPAGAATGRPCAAVRSDPLPRLLGALLSRDPRRHGSSGRSWWTRSGASRACRRASACSSHVAWESGEALPAGRARRAGADGVARMARSRRPRSSSTWRSCWCSGLTLFILVCFIVYPLVQGRCWRASWRRASRSPSANLTLANFSRVPSSPGSTAAPCGTRWSWGSC